MANGKLNLGKQSGGVLSLTFPDGVTNTEIVLPESGELVNKQYVDDTTGLKVALADFIGTNQSLALNGYQKLPGGLIIQWGTVSASVAGTSTILPIAFPNSALGAVTTRIDSSNLTTSTGYTGKSAYSNLTTTSITVYGDGSTKYFTIGN